MFVGNEENVNIGLRRPVDPDSYSTVKPAPAKSILLCLQVSGLSKNRAGTVCTRNLPFAFFKKQIRSFLNRLSGIES